MFRKALAIIVLGAASATGAAALASDWRDAPLRYAHPTHVAAPRYCPPHQTAYRWAAPAPRNDWRPAYAYPHYSAYHPRNDWRGYGWRGNGSHTDWHGNDWRGNGGNGGHYDNGRHNGWQHDNNGRHNGWQHDNNGRHNGHNN